MKSVAGFLLIAACLSSASAYVDIDDKYDYDSMLTNMTQFLDFMGCFLDKNPCSDVEQHIKIHIHEAVLNLCADCDDLQRHYARKMDEMMMKTCPVDYEKFKVKYDPDGNHYNAFLKAISKY